MLLNFRSRAVFAFETDPRQLGKHRSEGIRFSSPLLFASPMDIFEEERIVPLIDLRIPVFLVRLFSRSFMFENRVRRNWFE